MGKTRKDLLKTVIYLVLFALLCLSEKTFKFYGLALAFAAALLYCREKVLIILPIYAVTSILISFSVEYLICVVAALIIWIIVKIVHYKLKKPLKMLETNLLLLLSYVPQFIFFTKDTNQLIFTLIGVIASQLFLYLSIVFLYPVLVRGMKYRLSQKEELAFLAGIAVFAAGISYLRPFNINIYYGIAALIILISKGMAKEKAMFVAVALGLGAAAPYKEISVLAISAVMGLSCVIFYGKNKYIAALTTAAAFVVSYHFLAEDITLKTALPAVIGCILSMAVPQKVYNIIGRYRQSYQGKFALRTVVNRDREAVAVRINYVSKAFEDMRKILSSEQLADFGGIEDIVEETEMKVCGNCRNRESCNIKRTDEFYSSLINLAKKSYERSKVTLLDTNLVLSDNCIMLPHLVSAINESTDKKKARQIKLKGVMEGREMLINQMGGVAELMSKLASEVNRGFIYDTELETKIIDCLSYNNIVATDVIVYGKDKNIEEVSLVVREKDCEKTMIPNIISHILKKDMIINTTIYEVNDMVSINLTPAPKYNVSYGEFSLSKEEKCGDTRQAVRIARDKIMFILSDGMGSGENARNTANNIILLIESFYKAGYEHSVVLSMVSKLLAFRLKEDFSALDILILDTQTGDVDIIKQGGRESYLVSKKGCEIISGSSLPIGIVEECEPSIQTIRAEKEDVFIMISDGVADIINSDNICELFNERGFENPQYVAKTVIDNAERLGGERIDDMTCMAIKIK